MNMGAKECSNCKIGLMLRYGNKMKSQKRCTRCGYTESDQYNKSKGVVYETRVKEDYAIAVMKKGDKEYRRIRKEARIRDEIRRFTVH
jgi:ribosomal protein S27AE